jgi:hypothetical protein
MSDAIAGADVALAWVPGDVPGHAYAATASCMNSILKSATMVVRRRDVREVFMGSCGSTPS